ncbi:hypothetical protein ABT297_04115 [Dactylosporangium sp. NPDC000555]|uniref:hypothetical protein n=1 Tax=Dactylosporangium sp. NPDC000555 TaxID=3154260 RepID=UPI003331FDA1
MNDDAYAPLAQVAALAGVPAGTVRNWRYRGWIDHGGARRRIRVQGRLYNAVDVLLAERDTRLSGQSHRQQRPLAA